MPILDDFQGWGFRPFFLVLRIFSIHCAHLRKSTHVKIPTPQKVDGWGTQTSKPLATSGPPAKRLFISGIHFVPLFSTASAAKIFRSGCDSKRSPPEFNTQRSPAAAPHVGHRMEDCCFRVSSFIFISCLRRSRASRFGSGLGPEAEPSDRVYVFLTDMGRFCRNATISALFICNPPL